MGLDMYLLAKRKDKTVKAGSSTGACGGLFPLTIDAKGREEIGYWRKAYSVCKFIMDTSGFKGENDNCVDIPLTRDMCAKILQEANRRIDSKDYEDDYEKDDWVDTRTFFIKALTLQDSEDAKIVYYMWY